MTEIKVKVCYQVLGQKSDVFCIEPCCAIGTCYSKGKIFIPDEYTVYYNHYDEPLINFNGATYRLQEVITSKNDKPYMWNGKSKYFTIPLKFEVEEATHFS